MKKILFLLLSTIAVYGQVPADATPLENIQITNNVQDNTATKVTVQTSTGVQNWLPMVNLPVSTAQQTAIDAKVGDFINDGAATIAPSMNVVYDALSLKQLVFTGIDQTQFLTENDIVFDNTALTLTIATVKNGTAISSGNPVVFYTDGNGVAVKHTKTTPVVFTFTNTTGVWYFYFDTSGNPIASQTAPSDSSTIARVYRIYWNSALAVADKRVIESLEVYKNDATWVDRDWKDTQGAQYSSGFTISSNVLASGAPAIDGSNAVVNLTSGTIIDANLAYTLTNAATGTTKFTQNLGSGLLPATSGKFICITNNSSLILDKIPATDFPFLWNAATNTPEYLTQLGVRTGVTANNFFVYYLYAIQDPRRGETIKIKSAEVDFANSSLAEAHSWTQLQTLFPTLRDSKVRVLYKLTFEYKTSFDIGTKKTALRKIEDLRKQRTTSTATVGGVIPASTVTVTPIAGISSTNVQLALEELDSEKASNLQSAYNNSVTPQITTSTALGAVTLRRGSAADTDNVLVVQNGAGSDTFTVKGDGNTAVFGLLSGVNANFSSSATATQFVKSGGLSTEYLKADGSVSTLTNPITGTLTSGYIPKATGANSLGNSGISTDGSGAVDINYNNGLSGGLFQWGGTTVVKSALYSNGNGYFSGNLLIGTTTDNGVDKFQVNGGISTNALSGIKFTNGSTWDINTDATTFNISETNIATRFTINKTSGVLNIANLSGTGTRMVTADASGNLSTDSTTYAPLASPALTGTPTAPTAASGTNTTQIATTAFVQTATRPYKVYSIFISQSSTNAPTVGTTFENSIGSIVWSYVSTGVYRGTLAGAFTAGKVFFQLTFGGGIAAQVAGVTRIDDNTIQVVTNTGGGAADNQLSNASLEVRVYN